MITEVSGDTSVSDGDDGSEETIEDRLAPATAEAQRVRRRYADLAEALMDQFEALSMLAGINTPQGRHFAGFIFANEAAAQGLLAEHVVLPAKFACLLCFVAGRGR